MLPCHSCYICGSWKSKKVGGLKLSYRGKGKSHKQKELLWGAIKKPPRELTTELLYLELPTYFSLLQCKTIYTLYKEDSFLLKPQKQSSNQFFLLRLFLFIILIFFVNLQMTTERAFHVLNTVVIIFCLMYSLNIPHINQNPSFFSCIRRSIHLFKIQVKFRFRQHFTSLHRM